MIYKILKKIILKSLDSIKSFLNLDRFNDDEKEGKIFKLTKFKFIPYTSIIVPFKLGRSIRGLSFQNNLKKDVLGAFVNDIVLDKDKEILIQNLFKELKKEKSFKASSIVDLKDNANLANYPAWALVMPWEKIDIKKKFQNYRKQFASRRLRYVTNIDKENKNFENEDIFYSFYHACSQFSQTKDLLENIKRDGLIFRRNDSPKICILIDDKEWRWCMSGDGNHRAYIASALGYKSFQCVIDTIIDKKNLSNCYNVKNGLYSTSEATTIFDNFFSGDKCLRGIV